MDTALVSWLTLIVLMVTAGAGLWYAWEARKLWAETVRQTELQIRPFLVLRWEQFGYRLFVHNIGNGLAKEIRISNTRLGEEGKDPDFEIRWDDADYVSPRKKRRLTYQVFLVTGGREEAVEDRNRGFLANFGRSGPARGFELVLSYRDLVGNAYQTAVRIQQGAVVVLWDTKC